MDGIAKRIHVVTGGYSGIAMKTASYLSRLGGTVVMTGRNRDKGETAARQIADDTGGTLRFVLMDVGDAASVEAAAAEIEDSIGPVYGVVANAGKNWLGPSMNMPADDWRTLMRTNVDGSFNTARGFAKRMRGRGGSIVFVSSIASRISGQPAPFLAYGASKAAVTHMAQLLGVEWAPDGIRVNAVEPGYTATNALATIEKDAPEVAKALLSRIPVRRFLRPEEIAHTIAFLLSDLSSAMTASVLIADGGCSAM